MSQSTSDRVLLRSGAQYLLSRYMEIAQTAGEICLHAEDNTGKLLGMRVVPVLYFEILSSNLLLGSNLSKCDLFYIPPGLHISRGYTGLHR